MDRRYHVGIALALAALMGVEAKAQESDAIRQRQSTIKGLVVRTLPDGGLSGMAMGIVATAGNTSKGGRIDIRGTIGEQMKGSLDEAERYVRTLSPNLGNSQIAMSFVERESPKDGPSAGTAFAVLLRSLTEGYKIDPAVGITGDIAVNGEVRPIGGVSAKLRGAKADGCTVAIIPKANAAAVPDMLVSGDKLEILRTLHVFSAETVDEAVIVARADRTPELQEALTTYGEVQEIITKRALLGLKEPATVNKLKRVLELAPTHLTAQLALEVAQGRGPTTYTRVGSVVAVFAAASDFWDASSQKGNITRARLPKDVCTRMKKDLVALSRFTHPDVQDLRKNMIDWIDAIDRLLSYKGPVSEKDVAKVMKRRSELIEELDRLKTDQKLIEKMMREGY